MTQVETSRARTEVHPFRIDVPEAALADLRRRIEATQWPEKETVADQSQGVQLATMQELARYWATDYNGMKPAADDVQSVVIPGADHWVAEQAPEEMLPALTEFLAPYREGGGGLR